MKIQQMAFVLVAFFILFSIALVFYFSFKTATLKETSLNIRQDKIRETVQKIAGSPEFSWTRDDCSACIDKDKVFSLKNKVEYSGFWGNVPVLQIKQVYPDVSGTAGEIECTLENYPNCSTITLVNKTATNYTTEEAYVSICGFEDKRVSCKLGVVRMGVKS